MLKSYTVKRYEMAKLAFGTVDTWIIWNLTNGKAHVTDYSNASQDDDIQYPKT